MKISEFLPLFKLRSPNLMFFLGAGASVSAGIPTAWDIIWDFKRTIYCAENRKPISYCQDLSNTTTRAIIQDYFDKKSGFPKNKSESEYADYFEALYRTESDRRRFIDQLVTKGKPSYGHSVLATMLKMDKIRVVWTTNFDRTIEDATLPLLESSGKLVIANLDNSQIALQAINEARWPILIKLHGDFQSTRLKNTSDELQSQDGNLVYSFNESCRRYGLVVTGYSGRDKSVMDALNLAIDNGKGFPSGLFWLYRSDSQPFESVKRLIAKASASGIDAHLIEAETFDEFMSDLLLLEDNLPGDVENYLNRIPRIVSHAPIKSTEGTWPIIRLNGIRIISWPNVCRRIVCNIGGIKEVRNAIKESGASLIATRRNVGVLLFGNDQDAKKAFSKYKIQDFDLHTILPDKMKFYDSQELGLLYDALVVAIQREIPVRVERKRHSYYLIIPKDQINNDHFQSLRTTTFNLAGQVPQTTMQWAEAIRLRLEYKFDKLWLLIIPSIWLDRSATATVEEIDLADEFVRERLATRYNNKFSDVLDGWIKIIVGNSENKKVSAYEIQDGVDAVFEISRGTGFSYKENK